MSKELRILPRRLRSCTISALDEGELFVSMLGGEHVARGIAGPKTGKGGNYRRVLILSSGIEKVHPLSLSFDLTAIERDQDYEVAGLGTEWQLEITDYSKPFGHDVAPGVLVSGRVELGRGDFRFMLRCYFPAEQQQAWMSIPQIEIESFHHAADAAIFSSWRIWQNKCDPDREGPQPFFQFPSPPTASAA